MAAAGHLRKLIVEVVDARNLLPKDGHGTSSPYVVVDYHGQRKRTQTVVRDLNPNWNEVLEFNVGPPSSVFGDVLELDVNHDRSYGLTRRSNFLGRIRLSSTQFVRRGEEALIYFHLEKKSLFSWIQGEIGLRIYYSDGVAPPPSPPPPVVANVDGVEEPPQPPMTLMETEQVNSVEQAAEPTAETPTIEITTPVENAVEMPVVEGGPPPVETPPLEPHPPTEANVGAEEAPPLEPHPTPEANMGAEEAPPLEPHPPPEANVGAEEAPPKTSSEDDQIQTTKAEVNFPPQPIRRPVPAARFSLESAESQTIEWSTFDLVEKMHYLFVRVVKARSLATNGRPIVKIEAFGQRITSKPARKSHVYEWDQTFAFGREAPDSASIMEISVWDSDENDAASFDVDPHNFLGGLCFDVSEILLRDPPDSPLAPQWYRLEAEGDDVVLGGYLMLATWIGTQADDAFADAWKTDAAGNFNSRAKIYQSPKLWYLRATVIEAQDVVPLAAMKEASFQIKAQLGFQVSKTRAAVARDGSPSWNEDLVFVAAEPLTDHLVFTLETRHLKAPAATGVVRIPLADIERRVDDRKVTPRWCTLADPADEKGSSYRGRIQVRLCFDGGYHVMDEAAHVSSDYRPTARQLWKPPVGSIQLGVIGGKNLVPMKSTAAGKGSTDAYCVAKYGSKWVRTRTVCNNFDPKWNEQYTWKVYDPCTVLTIGVFDSSGEPKTDGPIEPDRTDSRIGKVRIRISTLKTGKVYRNFFPLLIFTAARTKKMGELEIAARFIRTAPPLDFIHVYSQPLLPLMHHANPLGVRLQDLLRSAAVETVASHLSRSEPPLRREVVNFMLDAESHGFSMRKVRTNWYRVISVAAAVIAAVKWVDDIRAWRNPTATILVHALLVVLIWFPDLIIPMVAFYAFVVGAWNYRFRSSDLLPHFDSKLSLVDAVDRDELDEEFDGVPSGRLPEVVRVRYDKLRALGARVQGLLGDLATQGERVQALVTWRDPRATGIFTAISFTVAVVLYVVPSKMVAVAFGFYYLRHPVFRDRLPSPALNFLRRLPSLSDRLM